MFYPTYSVSAEVVETVFVESVSALMNDTDEPELSRLARGALGAFEATETSKKRTRVLRDCNDFLQLSESRSDTYRALLTAYCQLSDLARDAA